MAPFAGLLRHRPLRLAATAAALLAPWASRPATSSRCAWSALSGALARTATAPRASRPAAGSRRGCSALAARAVFQTRMESITNSVRTLMEKVESGDLNLAPDYQRGWVWTRERASKLIESMFMGIYIPPVVLYEQTDGVLDVVDGKQRITSIMGFVSGALPGEEGPFALRDLEALTELEGTRFEDLRPRGEGFTRNTILDYGIACAIIKRESDPDGVYATYERMNSGGVVLNPQQLRRAVFRGPYVKLLDKCARNEHFLKILQKTEAPSHDGFQEVALRFFALHRQGPVVPPVMKRFLDAEMKHNQFLSEEEAARKELLLSRTCQLLCEVFGAENVGRLWDPEKKRFVRSVSCTFSRVHVPFHMALWDAISVVFAKYAIAYEKWKPVFVAKREYLVNMQRGFSMDNLFRGVTSKERRLLRFETCSAEVSRIVEQPRLFSSSVRRQLFQAGQACGICGEPIATMDDAEVDHIVPYCMGGATQLDNAQLVHRRCNRRKSSTRQGLEVQLPAVQWPAVARARGNSWRRKAARRVGKPRAGGPQA